MLEAGQREREIAIQKGHFHEGVPAITVIVDGGWSKRLHKHSYNAKSGVAIIIGKETGQLLHIGVRNKFCHACARKIPKENHTCYRNWTASSSEMEADIILEGFWKQKECTEFAIQNSLEMVTAQCILLYSECTRMGSCNQEGGMC